MNAPMPRTLEVCWPTTTSVTVFWLTRWLVAACALLSAFELARRLSRAQAEAHALAVKDRVMAENYRSLQSEAKRS